MTDTIENGTVPSISAAQLEWRYYLAMAAPFAIDVAISGIFTAISSLGWLFLQNLYTSTIILLFGIHVGARYLFRPIKRYLQGNLPFSAIERVLTQLPLRSAVWSASLTLPILMFRLLSPLIADLVSPGTYMPDLSRITWLDAGLTVFVQTTFIFVVTYFLVSGYLERLCHALFVRDGVNLGLFFGNFSLKLSVALYFTALAPMVLITGDVISYEGDKLLREVIIDLSASAFGLAVISFWVARSLTRPLARLDQGMRQVAEGRLDIRLPVTSNEEIGELTYHFNRMTEGLRERERIRETFGKYVSESVASALMQDAVDGRLKGQLAEATLMFTDIEGFTSLSAELDPETLVGIINEYLALVVEPIQQNGGVVNNFIGDGLFASFNMPLANPDHAGAALRAAIEIQARLEGRVFKGGVRLKTRIGINTGAVIGGTIGAGERLSYTLLGDAVNIAARLEELNKQHGTSIMASATTREAAGAGFSFTLVGDVPIRGRTGKTAVYSVAPA